MTITTTIINGPCRAHMREVDIESTWEAQVLKELVDDFDNGMLPTSGCPIVRMLCAAYGVDANRVPPARWAAMVPSIVDAAKSALLKYYERELSS